MPRALRGLRLCLAYFGELCASGTGSVRGTKIQLFFFVFFSTTHHPYSSRRRRMRIRGKKRRAASLAAPHFRKHQQSKSQMVEAGLFGAQTSFASEPAAHIRRSIPSPSSPHITTQRQDLAPPTDAGDRLRMIAIRVQQFILPGAGLGVICGIACRTHARLLRPSSHAVSIGPGHGTRDCLVPCRPLARLRRVLALSTSTHPVPLRLSVA